MDQVVERGRSRPEEELERRADTPPSRAPVERPGPAPGGEARPADTDAPRPAQPKRRFAFLRAHWLAALVALAVIAAGGFYGVRWWLEARHFESTDDAFIDAREFAIAPKVGGYVTAVLVTDNQHVPEGAVLFRIEQRDFQIALQQAEATLAQAEAGIGGVDAQVAQQQAQIEVAGTQVRQADAVLTLAQQEEARAADLVARGAGTVQTEQQRRAALIQAQADAARTRAALVAAQRQLATLQAQRKSAEATRDVARAQVAPAHQNLAYPPVPAEQGGRIAKLTGAGGQLAQAGQALSMFVPDELWVTANFKETQITDMRQGQPVDVEIDAYPGRVVEGWVASIQPGSGTAFSLLPAENATGNYVKVVQRVPVKITLGHMPNDITLGPGMSVVPKVRVR